MQSREQALNGSSKPGLSQQLHRPAVSGTWSHQASGDQAQPTPDSARLKEIIQAGASVLAAAATRAEPLSARKIGSNTS